VVDAIGEGHTAARSIDRFLRGENGLQEPRKLPVVSLTREEIDTKLARGEAAASARVPIRSIPLEERRGNFNEVDLTLTEAEALAEAERCLRCGVCSECLECLTACDRGAINHDMTAERVDLNVGAIILATGFADFDPRRAPELGYGRLENVLTAMEVERLINPSGPTAGEVLLKNGKHPASIAILHCVGSRDEKYNDYCSRACCMYSLKLAQLLREHVHAEVHEVYRDMRAFGKGYEEFFNRTQEKGVHFYHGRVQAVKRLKAGRLRVTWGEAFHGQPDQVDVDMVILATGFEPQPDNHVIAAGMGVNLSHDGFFLERHPKLAPVETINDGMYLAGACQAPKDIPDSVAQAGGAAAAAISLIDQGTIFLDPIIAEVDAPQCAACGQCVAACPYGAIHLDSGRLGEPLHARVNDFQCRGCGTCAAACPNKAITLVQYDDRQLVDEIIGALSDR
jgi:heterodisulfide reductase subunit A